MLSVLVAAAPACSRSSTIGAAASDAVPPAPAFDGWIIKSDTVIAHDKIGAVAARLGANVKGLRNVTYEVKGKTIQVNVIAAPDSTEANKVYVSLTTAKAPWAAVRKGDVVYEFVGQNDVMQDIKTAHDKLAGP